MNPVRKRRLVIISLILAAAVVATALGIFALQRNVTYLFSPTEIDAGESPDGAQFRLGGVVKEGTVHRAGDSLKVDFVVTDRFHDMPVVYTGILPDLFREGQSIIATGHMQGGTFVATDVLAKHDETYMPPEVADAIRKAEREHKTPSTGSHDPAGGNPTDHGGRG